ncbi:class F sortase [Streptomyces calidiresistens]|uniref:Class F sortase n=1 Tax=Streptomyces calidiresistens TaxID=1485586 RepID=A0A7W3T8L6_9ACTN|nr:class F sortase [Streptomyces calidiresistens]MBB0232924.1 class F sortase [Streptomyces calidiresistens]
MTATTTGGRSGARGGAVTTVAWAVLLFGLWLWGRELTGGEPDLGGPVRLSDGRVLPAPVRPLDGEAVPVRLEMDGPALRAEVIERGVEADGGVEPPPFEAADTAGWFRDGPVPGAAGAALLVGHVDTDTGRAVFYDLSTVEPGAEVEVLRSDGRTAVFTVERVDVVELSAFDPEAVYGPHREGRAELRLITCGGEFDAERSSYSANVVVSAYLTETRDPPGPPADPAPS